MEKVSRMAIDPVCYADVDEEKATQKTTYRGETYYFCTPSCRKKFEENPKKYTILGPTSRIDPGMSC